MSSGTYSAPVIFTIGTAASPAIGADVDTIVPGQSGQTFNYQVNANNNPSSYGASPLPDGLSINTTSGSITGTPTNPGRYSVTLTATNSYGASSVVVTFNIYAPLPITSGLLTWYNADSGVSTAIGGLVTQWNDSSSTGVNLQPPGSVNAPTLGIDANSGNPIVTFANNGSLQGYESSVTATDLTIIAVAGSATDFTAHPTAVTDLFELGSAFYQYKNGYKIYNNGSVSYGVTFVPVQSGSSLTMDSVVYDSGSDAASYYSEGVFEAGGTFSYVQPTNGTVKIGPFNGPVAELLVYNRVLSVAEQQQVELYLATKYNLPYTVPAAPIISPGGGTYSSSVSVSISGGPAANIRYTLDGTAPTEDSPVYTGAFTLTDSRVVTAAFFVNSVQTSPAFTAQFYIGDSGQIGISDAWQMEYFGHTGIDPNALSPGGSGLTNLQAYLYGYNPAIFSTNGDGLSDLVNYQLGYAGSNTDINGDGLTNAEDLALGLDPFDAGVNPVPPTPPTGTPGDTVPPTITLVSPDGATLLP
jgi:hypothetical protein